jgi:hypothetical protein
MHYHGGTITWLFGGLRMASRGFRINLEHVDRYKYSDPNPPASPEGQETAGTPYPHAEA